MAFSYLYKILQLGLGYKFLTSMVKRKILIILISDSRMVRPTDYHAVHIGFDPTVHQSLFKVNLVNFRMDGQKTSSQQKIPCKDHTFARYSTASGPAGQNAWANSTQSPGTWQLLTLESVLSRGNCWRRSQPCSTRLRLWGSQSLCMLPRCWTCKERPRCWSWLRICRSWR